MTPALIAPALRPLAEPLASLREDPANARAHPAENVAAIARSLELFGQQKPVVALPDGTLVAGNGTFRAAQLLGWTELAVQRTTLAAEEARAYAVADNATALSAQWNVPALDAALRAVAERGFTPVDVGFLDLDPAAVLAQIERAQRGHEPKPAPGEDPGPEEPPDVPISRRGELYELGPHRLLCGDATSAEDVARLMDGKRAGLMNTDPPYGVGYANDDRPGVRVAKPRVANDDLHDTALQAFLEAAFRAATAHALRPNAAWYLWHAHLTQGFFAAAAAAAANVVLSRQIIWVKPVLLLTRGQYHWRHEPCFFGWVRGHQPPDYGRGHGERDQTTVWEIAGVSQAERNEFNHSTHKPCGLFETPIVKHLRADEVCYEPFAGTGPQFIAAAKLGCRCFGLEIEPAFCDVIRRRWTRYARSAGLDPCPGALE